MVMGDHMVRLVQSEINSGRTFGVIRQIFQMVGQKMCHVMMDHGHLMMDRRKIRKKLIKGRNTNKVMIV